MSLTLTPSFEDFERGWTAGRNQVVHARIAADLDTPVSLMLKLSPHYAPAHYVGALCLMCALLAFKDGCRFQPVDALPG